MKSFAEWFEQNWDKVGTILAFGGGIGITIHAVARELFDKGGYAEILKLQGEYIGLTIAIIAFVVSLRFWRNK